MNKHLLTGLCLVLAVALYAVGLALPGSLFLTLGALAEGTFWIRLFRSIRGSRSDTP